MNLKDIAAIAGKPGLYKVLKPTRSGMIVSKIDEPKKKTVVGTTHRVSILQEISIYINDNPEMESIELGKVFANIKEKYEGKCEYGTSKEELGTFLEGVLPNYDRDRVYPSDIKKLASWYNLLIEHAPEVFEEAPEEEAKEESAK